MLSRCFHYSKNTLHGALPSSNVQVMEINTMYIETLIMPCMFRIGPLVTSWCMRMEAKNSYFKRIAMIGNFKNVAFSVAKQHQRLMCSYVNGSYFFGTRATLGPGIILSSIEAASCSHHYWFRVPELSFGLSETIW